MLFENYVKEYDWWKKNIYQNIKTHIRLPKGCIKLIM